MNTTEKEALEKTHPDSRTKILIKCSNKARFNMRASHKGMFYKTALAHLMTDTQSKRPCLYKNKAVFNWSDSETEDSQQKARRQ